MPSPFGATAVPIAGLATGVDVSAPPYLIPDTASPRVRNVACASGEVYVLPGWDRLSQHRVETGFPILHISQFHGTPFDAGDPVLAFTKNRAAYLDPETLTYTYITPAVGLSGSDLIHSSAFINDRLIYCNGADRVMQWLGTGLMEEIADLITNGVEFAWVAAAYAGHAMIGRVKADGRQQPERFDWSDLNNPALWRPGFIPGGGLNGEDVTSEAGFRQLPFEDMREAPHILAMEPLRDFLVIYTGWGVYILQYVGAPFIWSLRLIQREMGLMHFESVVNFGSRHVFLGRNDFYVFNGIDLQSVGRPIRDYFFKNIRRSSRVIAYRVHQPDSAVFGFSSVDSPDPLICDKAVRFNLVDGAWTIEDFPFTAAREVDETGLRASLAGPSWDAAVGSWDGGAPTWDSSVTSWNAAGGSWDASGPTWDGGADVDRQLRSPTREVFGDDRSYLFDRGTTAHDRQDFIASWLSKLYDFGEPLKVKQLVAVELDMVAAAAVANSTNESPPAGPYEVEMFVYAYMDRDRAATVYGPFPMVISSGIPNEPQIQDVRIGARFFQFELRTEFKDRPWVLRRFVPYLAPRGLA